MLSIFVHSGANPGFLDLPANAALQMESFSEAFQLEEEAGEFSLPLDLYWTDTNRLRLGFKERLENFNKAENWFIISVYDSNFPVFTKAKLTLVSKSGSFNYRNGKFSVSVSGTRGIFSSIAKNKKMTELQLGGTIAFPVGMDSREFAYWHYHTGYTQFPQIRFAPVGFEGFYDQERFDFNGEFLAKDTVNNIVETGGGAWLFGRPTEANPAVAAGATTVEYMDYRTIPFFRVKFLVEKIFTDLGYAVTGEFLSNPDFDNLVLFNNYGIERYSAFEFTILTSFDENTSINPGNHVPDMLVDEFLKSILPGLGIFPVFIDDKNVVLVYHNTNIEKSGIANCDDVLLDNFESNFIDGGTKQDGYKITLATDENDSYYSERVKDISTKTLVSRVATRADLDNITSGSLTTDNIVYVEAENMYYTVADATADPMLWDAFAEELNEYISGSGDKQVDIKFSTLAQYVTLDAGTGLYINKGYLATRQKGTHISRKSVLVKNTFGLRLFYTTAPGDVTVIPTSYNHNRNADNTLKEKYTLALQQADSIALLHKAWQNILQNAEDVKIALLANSEVTERLRRHPKIQVAGLVVFVKKIEKTIPIRQILELTVVPL
jgi:hypothetical protein